VLRPNSKAIDGQSTPKSDMAIAIVAIPVAPPLLRSTTIMPSAMLLVVLLTSQRNRTLVMTRVVRHKLMNLLT